MSSNDKATNKNDDGTVCEYTLCENCDKTMYEHTEILDANGMCIELQCPDLETKFKKKKSE